MVVAAVVTPLCWCNTKRRDRLTIFSRESFGERSREREGEGEKEGGMKRGKGGREIKGMGGHHALSLCPSRSGHLVPQLIHHNFTDAQHIATNQDECGRGSVNKMI